MQDQSLPALQSDLKVHLDTLVKFCLKIKIKKVWSNDSVRDLASRQIQFPALDWWGERNNLKNFRQVSFTCSMGLYPSTKSS